MPDEIQTKANQQGSGRDGPYCRLTLGQLEGMFANRRSDLVFLRILDHELGFRTTDRADRLQKRVGKSLAALPIPAAPLPHSRKRGVAKPPAAPAEQRPERHRPLRIFPPAGKANAPDAVLPAWTAMEALSPQTYRKPEDLTAGNRRCVSALDGGLPWEADERSRKNYMLNTWSFLARSQWPRPRSI